jgi:hypothetical protein
MRGKGGATTLAVLAAGGLLMAAAPAGASVTATTNAFTVFTAMAAPGQFGSTPSSAVTFPVIPKNALASTPSAFPAGTSTSVLPPFPLASPYAVLSTGDARVSDQPGASSSADDGADPDSAHGDSAYDTTILRVVRITVPAGQACLSFDFRFLSAEYPSRLTSQFNDAFIAELIPDSGGAPTWTTSGASILKLDSDFALGSDGRPMTIKSTGAASLSPAEAAGTPYGGATAPLRAQVPVSAGDVDALFFSIFDHGDRAGDTAVFIDNLTFSATACQRGVVPLGPAVAITAPTISATVNSATPTLTGTADGAGGDVRVRIYNGGVAAGAPLQTLVAARSGTSWSATTQPLAPGPYTAQATQANGPLNGVSAPTTFSVVQPQTQPSQQPPGDRDHDGIPDDIDPYDGSLPPIPGKSFDARVVSGRVFIKYPAGKGPRAVTPPKGFVPLKGAANVPIGSQLDTRRGRVAVTSAADTGSGKTQTSDFYDGIFAVKQSVPKKTPKKPVALITDLVLKGEPPRSECAPLKGAAAAAAKKKKRAAKSVLGKLWGNGKGKFRTTGKYSSATVRGTIWLTQDRCDGTLTTVKRGIVSVRDFKRQKTVSVKAGHSYLARAQRAAAKSNRRAK